LVLFLAAHTHLAKLISQLANTISRASLHIWAINIIWLLSLLLLVHIAIVGGLTVYSWLSLLLLRRELVWRCKSWGK
jgi:hypothetical protein